MSADICFRGEYQMASAKAARLTVFGIAAVALLIAPIAFAQTMGEYGGVTANAATSSGIAAPKLDSSLESAKSRDTGAPQSVEVRQDDSEQPAADPQTDVNDTPTSQSSDEWTRVK
jgi:hypothetical protein